MTAVVSGFQPPAAIPPALRTRRAVTMAARETAVFGMGCFWNPQVAFQNTPGVTSATVGYASAEPKLVGSLEKPSYFSVSLGDGYTEAVCVEYDPGMVSYEALLSVFWSEHDASAPVTKAQYASVIWPTTDEQRRLAEAQVTAYGDSVVTVIGERPTDGAAGGFVEGETYHRKCCGT